MSAVKIKSTMSDLLHRTRSAGQELRKSIESVRARIGDLKDRKGEIEALPPLIEVANQRVDEFVAHLAPFDGHGYPSASRFACGVDYDPPSKYADPLQTMRHYLMPLLANAIKDQVRDLYAETPGISELDRKAKLNSVERELLDAELVEEALVRSAEVAGFAISRRSDADPRAVLAADEVLP